MNTEVLVETIIEIADSKKAENIVSLNIAKKSSLADFFLICEGNSERHVKTLRDEIMDQLKEKDVRPLRTDIDENGEWAVIDYGSVIVHIFRPDARQKYRLEEMWSGKQKVSE